MNHLNSHDYLLETLKKSINSWDFSNPNWNKLPPGFPDCNLNGLTTKQERHLFDGIKLAWLASEGRNYLIKGIVRQTAVITAIILIIILGKTLTSSPDKYLTRSVSAKTVGQTFGDLVEATMSAVFRY